MIFCGKYKSISLDNSRDRELALNNSKGLLEVYSWPSEIKKGKNSTKPTKNFNILSKYGLEIKPGLIIDTSDKIRPINDKAYSYPIYLLGE